MIPAIIRWSLNNRFLVLIATLFLTWAGCTALKTRPSMRFPISLMYR